MPPTESWRTFPYHRKSSALVFPRDEGWHYLLPGNIANPSLSNMEWVYTNAHLDEVGGQGRKFVIFAAYFTQGLRLLVVRAFDADDRYIGAWTGTTFGLLTPRPDRLDLTYRHPGGVDRWRNVTKSTGELDPFHSRLTAVDDADAFQVDLELINTKTPYEAGGIGWLPFGRRGWFGYYSLTRLDARGILRLSKPSGGIEEIRVKGMAWFDHQWGPFYVTPFRIRGLEEYEWMSIQLDSGDEIMLTTVWDTTGETPDRDAFGGAGLIRKNNKFEKLIGSTMWKRTRFWRSPTQGAIYSAGWTFEAEPWNTRLVITPRYPDQMTPIIDATPAVRMMLERAGEQLLNGPVNYLGDFWEGSCIVEGIFDGQPVRGYAFAELIKRYEVPELEVHVPRNDSDVTVVAWRVTNWDVQAPLTYRFFLETPDGTVLVDRPGLDVSVTVLDDPSLPRRKPLIARIVASSIDGTLSKTTAIRLELP